MSDEPSGAAGGLTESVDQLDAAIDRATRLLADLERSAADLVKNPPRLPAADLEIGSRAMERAVVSARRLLQSLLSARGAWKEKSERL